MTAISDGVQLDLFGEIESAEAERERDAARAARLDAEWLRLARTLPSGAEVVWTAPWDCADGTPRGATKPGWWCWKCGWIEANEYLLGVEHGLSRHWPDLWAGSWCTRIALLQNQTRRRPEEPCTCGHEWTQYAFESPAMHGGEHCTCTCHNHEACSTPDACIPLIEADSERLWLAQTDGQSRGVVRDRTSYHPPTRRATR